MKKLIVAIIILSTAGCSGGMSWVAWRGYDDPLKTPSPSSYKSVDGECFSIGVQNLDEKQKKAVMEAAGEVCKVIKSEEFKIRVIAQEWMASCDIVHEAKKDIIKGEEVFNIISNGIPDFSVNPQKPWMAIAQAQRSENDHTRIRMAINPSRINKWYTPENKGLLVNTIAHESTHLISFSFRDRGHGTTQCPDAKLVSYGIGNLVEELANQ
jgi:hypothetical protein